MGRIDIHSLFTVSVRHTGHVHGALITPHRTPPHHAHTGFVCKTDTLDCVRTHLQLPSIVSGCLIQEERRADREPLARHVQGLSLEGDVDSLEVGVASPLTLPSLKLPFSGSESAS